VQVSPVARSLGCALAEGGDVASTGKPYEAAAVAATQIGSPPLGVRPGKRTPHPWPSKGHGEHFQFLHQPVRAVRVERSPVGRGGPNSDNQDALFIRDQKAVGVPSTPRS
jgi:hypothetical protein